MAELTRQIEDVHGSGIYPATGPLPPGKAVVRTPAQLGHPEMWRTPPMPAQWLETAALMSGRAILGGYFVYNGINHFRNRKTMAQYAASKGVPAPDAAIVIAGALAVAGGLSLLSGAWPKVGAGLITTFILGVTPQMHAFWKEKDPQQRMAETINFTKNIALMGGSCFAAAHPEPWPLSPSLHAHSGLPSPAHG